MDSKQLEQRIRYIFDGVPLSLENMTIRNDKAGKLLVIGWTQTYYLENVTKTKIAIELENLKSDFSSLVSQFPELKSLTEMNRMKIEYHIAWNGDKNGIEICSEIDGEISWYL